MEKWKEEFLERYHDIKRMDLKEVKRRLSLYGNIVPPSKMPRQWSEEIRKKNIAIILKRGVPLGTYISGDGDIDDGWKVALSSLRSQLWMNFEGL